jgi:fibronectin type 3 domain-containing protein
VTRQTIPAFDEKFFSDPRLYSFSKQFFSGFTNQYEGIALSDSQPLPPLALRVENPGRGRTLIVSWQLPEHINFQAVKVYRSEDGNQLGNVVGTLTVQPTDVLKSQTYLDKGLTNRHIYFYRVRSVNANNQESAIQEPAIAMPTDTIPPDAPADVKVAAASNKQVEISWLNPDSDDLAFIRVYRATQRGMVGTVIYDDGVGDQSTSDQKRHYIVDKEVIENTPYYYTVTSVDNDGNESSTDLLSVPSRSGNYNPFEPITF